MYFITKLIVFIFVSICPDKNNDTFYKEIQNRRIQTDEYIKGSEFNQKEHFSECEIADKCWEISEIQTLTTEPTDTTCSQFIKSSVRSCLTGATKEDSISQCFFNENPTVWFQIKTDLNASQLYTFVSTKGRWQPVWAVYSGTCETLTLIKGGNMPVLSSCSNDDDNDSAHFVNIPKDDDGKPVETIYIAVSGLGTIDQPEFLLEAFTQAECLSCFENKTYFPEASFTVTSRSGNRPLNDLTFCQGEEVSIKLQIYFEGFDAGADWLHGLIPHFGPGWDVTSINPADITVSPEGAEWLGPSDGDCAPYFTEKMPLLCSYFDENGILRLCNIKTKSCPCTPPLIVGSPSPPGWFWISQGGPTCLNDCNPSNQFGLSESNSGQYIDIEMNLKTKSFPAHDDCQTHKDLQISFIFTSDEVTGCWNDPLLKCLNNINIIGPKWKLDCRPPVSVLFENKIMNETIFFQADFSTDNPLSIPVILEGLHHPDLKGIKSHILPFGSGSVIDTLLNFTRDTLIAEYLVWAMDTLQFCGIPVDTFKVTVYPYSEYSLHDLTVCSDSCTWLDAGIRDTLLKVKSVFWKNGDTTQIIRACFSDSTNYRAILYDKEDHIYLIDYQILEGTNPDGKLLAEVPLCGDTIIQLFVDAFDTTLANMNYQLFLCSDTTEILLKADSLPFLYTFKLKNDKEEYCFAASVTSGECIAPKTEIIITNPNYIIGKPCEDNDPNTINDVYDEDCICKGEINNSLSFSESNGTIKIYPNPASDYVDVVFDKEKNDVEIFLISSVGQPLLFESFDILNGKRISVRDLPVGIYFLKIIHQNKYFYIKVLKV